MLPFKGRNRVTSIYGNRGGKSHDGVDIVGDDSKEIRAVSDGKIVTSTIITDKNNKTWEWGNYVRLDTADGTREYYCHMKSQNVKSGQIVKAGDILGIMGNTGFSQGEHLHFETRNASNVAFNPTTILGIPNKVGIYSSNEISTASLSEDTKHTNKLRLYVSVDKPVSSQLLKEGAIAKKTSAGFETYEPKVARTIENGNISQVYESLKDTEMETNNILYINK